MPTRQPDPLFSAAVFKMTIAQKGMIDQPGFRVIYRGTLSDLGVTDEQVNAYIKENLERLEAHIAKQKSDR